MVQRQSLGLVVLGAHRSGTSALARVINFMGAKSSKDLLGPTDFNPAGHWESETVYDLNERFLRKTNARWNDWTFIGGRSAPTGERGELIKEGAAYLREEFAEADLFVLKDPRFCILLPEWREAFEAAQMRMCIALCLRNPLEVIASLERRDSMSAEAAAFLWLRHVLDAEYLSRDMRRTLIFYDRMIENWPEVVGRVAKDLDIVWPRRLDQNIPLADDPIDKQLRHHTFSQQDVQLRQDLHDWLKRTHRVFERASQKGLTEEAQGELDDVRTAFNSVATAARPLGAKAADGISQTLILEYRLAQAKQEMQDTARKASEKQAAGDEQTSRLRDVNAALSSENDGFRRRVEEALTQISRLKTESEQRTETTRREHDATIRQHIAQVADVEQEFSNTRQEVQRLRDEAASLAETSQGLRDEVAFLGKTNQDLLDKVASLDKFNEGLRGEVASLDKTNQGLRGEVASLGETNQDLLDKVASLGKTNQDLLDKVASLGKTNQDLLDKVASFGKTNQGLLDKVASLGKTNQGLRGDVTSLGKINQDLRAEVASLAGTNRGLRGEVESLAGTNQNLRDEVASLAGTNQNLRDEVASLAGTNQTLRGEVASLETQIRSAHREKDAAVAAEHGEVDHLRRALETNLHRAKVYRSVIEAALNYKPRQARRLRVWFGGNRALDRLIKASGRVSPASDVRSSLQTIGKSGLFDAEWYERTYPEVAALGIDPLKHFVLLGAYQGYDPCPLFDSKWYASAYPDVMQVGLTPVLHYVRFGAAEGRFPNLVFDTGFYSNANPDIARSAMNPLTHFMRQGSAEGKRVNPALDLKAYARTAPDLASSGMTPLEHFLRLGLRPNSKLDCLVPHDLYQKIESSELFDTAFYRRHSPETNSTADAIYDYIFRGWRSGKQPTQLFDTRFYLEKNPSLLEEAKNPFYHFLTEGAAAGLAPHPLFDTRFYFQTYPDIAEAGVNPILHYLRHGWKGRYRPNPFFDAAWYIETYNDVKDNKRNPLLDYLLSGHTLGRRPHPDFDPAYYLDVNPDVRAAGVEPFLHFVTNGYAEGRVRTTEGRTFRRVPLSTTGKKTPRAVAKKAAVVEPVRAAHSTSPKWGHRIPILAALTDRIHRPDEVSPDVVSSAEASVKSSALRISVVMPTWNRAGVVTAAIESVLAQTFPVHELLVVDDGSTDETCKLIKTKFADAITADKLIVIERPHEGLSATRNAGLANATGDLVAYLDSDNVWHPAYTLFMTAVFAQAPGLGTAYCAENIQDVDKGTNEVLAQPFSRPSLLNRNFIDLNCFVHRRNIADRMAGFDTAMTRLVDWELIIRYTRYNAPAFVPIRLVEYVLDKNKLNNVTYSENWQPNWAHVKRKHLRERIKLGVDPLRIGYVIWDWPALSQTFVLNELRWLLANGYDVRVYYSTAPDLAAELDFDIEAIQVKSVDDLVFSIETDGRNVLHSPFAYPATTLLTWPAAQKTGILFTFMPAGVDICHEKNRLRNRIAEVAADPLCLGLITLGSFHRQLLAEAGVPTEKMVMERQAVGLPAFGSRREKRSKPRIVSIGRFIEKKGLAYLIAAAEVFPDAEILLYGYGPLEDELRADVAQRGLRNVSFPGTLDDTKSLHDVYYDADLFVLPCVEAPNGDMDGLPTVLLEAMAAGLPVVTTRLANIPDLIVDNVFGFLADPGDVPSLVAAIGRCLDLTKTGRERLVRRATERARSYASDTRMMTTLDQMWRSRSVDIVLVTYNRPECDDGDATIDIIDRVYAHTATPFNLIVVDNASQDPFVQRLESRYGDRANFNLLRLPKNVYVGPATNVAIDAGTSDYIIYLCSKECFILQNGWEANLIRAMDAEPKAGMGGYLISLPNFRTGAEYLNYPGFENWRGQDYAAANPDLRLRHLQGGLLIIRRSTYEKVGGFSEAVPHNGTDIEYSYYLESCSCALLDIDDVYSVSSKTWPGPHTLVNERALAVHPLTLDSAKRFSALSIGDAFHCNLCGWSNPEDGAGLAGSRCPDCASTPFDRSVMRHLSLSGVLQRRPKVLCICEGDALAAALIPICRGSVTISPDMIPSSTLAQEADLATFGMVVVDFDTINQTTRGELAQVVFTLVARGARAVLGGTPLSLDDDESFIARLRATGVSIDEVEAASNKLRLDPRPIWAVGFPLGRELRRDSTDGSDRTNLTI